MRRHVKTPSGLVHLDGAKIGAGGQGLTMVLDWGKCLGYTGKPCANCGRYRVERYENGHEICDKCNWCPQEDRYVEWEEFYPEEDWHDG
jgi:hypothetical protein